MAPVLSFMNTPFLPTGEFTLGCNYWASHAGTAMWRDWRPEVVAKDFGALASHGLKVLRVFPLWPDFQPLLELKSFGGDHFEYRYLASEEPLSPDNPAALDLVMVERFATFCGLAQRHGLKLIVGLVTGWMSGRLFVPPALVRRNVITDPVALAWQARYVSGLVTRLRGEGAIQAWDLGNECNCMGHAVSADEAYNWTATIAHAIRAADPSRPIVSGMHSISPQAKAIWRIRDQADLTDVLTTHPYPYWVQHGRVAPLDAYRTTLLPTVETRLYGDVGGKPCIAEEIGSMGPMVSSDEIASTWARANLLSLWAHDARAFFWWCSFDQTRLAHAPYDWVGVEAELGLIRNDGSPKPVLGEMRAFAAWLGTLPFASLPRRRTHAVCVLSHGQDAWAVAIGAFALGKQAGMEITFASIDQTIPESSLYLLPAISGLNSVHRHEWEMLRARVHAGATLYLSVNDAVLPDFAAFTGLHVQRRHNRVSPERFNWADGVGGEGTITSGEVVEFKCAPGVEVLVADSRGNPVLVRHRYGAGEVFTLTFPLETQAALAPDGLEPGLAENVAARRVYQLLRATLGASNAAAFTCDDAAVGVTEHTLADGTVVVVALNCSPRSVATPWRLRDGLAVKSTWRGETPKIDGLLSIPAQEACVIIVGS